jgi:electron transport complex protein RnfD
VSKLTVTPNPHIKTGEDISGIMMAVCVALTPAMVFGFHRFGYWAAVVTVLSVASCVIAEAACQRARNRPVTVNDYSAVVTGLLLAAVLPPNVVWYVPVIGGVIAIGVVKHAFGGLGANIWNPALLGRAFLQAAFPTQINSGRWPSADATGFWENFGVNLRGTFGGLTERAAQEGADIVTGATALEQLSGVSASAAAEGTSAATYTGSAELAMESTEHTLTGVWVEDGLVRVDPDLILDLFLGNVGGCIGEISALALLLGGAYLLWRGIITWHIPLAYCASAAALAWLLPAPYQTAAGETAYTAWGGGPALFHLAAGGLMIGALFMATDMVTSPLTAKGQILFGIGCGVLTMVIRLYGGYPEGVCYSIILMNTTVPLLDAWTRPRVYGTKKPPESPAS